MAITYISQFSFFARTDDEQLLEIQKWKNRTQSESRLAEASNGPGVRGDIAPAYPNNVSNFPATRTSFAGWGSQSLEAKQNLANQSPANARRNPTRYS